MDMIETEYFITIRIINGKPRKVIIDLFENIINRNPSKYELKDLKIYTEIKGRYRIPVSFDGKKFFWLVMDKGRFIRNPTKDDLYGTQLLRYNSTNVCPICRKEYESGKIPELTDKSLLYPKNVRYYGNDAYCTSHKERIDPNSRNNKLKSVSDRRTGNLRPDSTQEKGDKGEDLLCEWKGYINLNKKYDNFEMRRDCYNPKTGEYHHAKIAYYDSKKRCWDANLKKEIKSIIEGYQVKSTFIFCVSKDRKFIERLYEIPEEDMIMTHVSIYMNSIGSKYDQYRINVKEEMDKINKLWNKINNK